MCHLTLAVSIYTLPWQLYITSFWLPMTKSLNNILVFIMEEEVFNYHNDGSIRATLRSEKLEWKRKTCFLFVYLYHFSIPLYFAFLGGCRAAVGDHTASPLLFCCYPFPPKHRPPPHKDFSFPKRRVCVCVGAYGRAGGRDERRTGYVRVLCGT